MRMINDTLLILGTKNTAVFVVTLFNFLQCTVHTANNRTRLYMSLVLFVKPISVLEP
jgi:hypothetical protein